MSHEVESLVVNKERGLAWHGLGEAADGIFTKEEAIERGFNGGWIVELKPAYQRLADDRFKVVENRFLVVRNTDQSVLGDVGNWYKPFQIDDLLDFGQVLVDEYGAVWDTAGSLRGGKLTFASMKVADLDITIAGLPTELMETHLLLANSNDGSLAFTGKLVRTRTVCKNTFSAALGEDGSEVKIRHTGDLSAKVDEARRTLEIVTKAQREFNEIAERLADVDIAVEEFDLVLADVLPAPKAGTGVRSANKVERDRAAAKGNWLHSQTIPDDLRFTKWGALQGITEWAEHKTDQRNDKRVDSRERRLLSTVFGGTTADIGRRTAKRLLIPA